MLLNEQSYLDILTAGRNNQRKFIERLFLSKLELAVNSTFIDGRVPVQMNRLKKLDKMIDFHGVFIVSSYFIRRRIFMKGIRNCRYCVACIITH